MITLVYFVGDYYGQGKVREKEFYRSCATLGVTKEHAVLISDPYVKIVKLVTNYLPGMLILIAAN